MKQDLLSIDDVRRALSYMAGGAALHLLEVTLVDRKNGDVQHPNLKAALDESGLDLGIYWFAIREEKGTDTVLLLPLYSQKFQKLIRKWNRTSSRLQFELSIIPIEAPKAASFYAMATHKQPNLIRIVLKRLE